MKRVSDIRYALGELQDVFLDSPEGETHGGEEAAVITLWPGENGLDLAETAAPRGDDDVDDEGFAELDELAEFAPDIELENAQRLLDGEKGEKIKAALEIRGTDALAWYVSFHVRRAQWGIYIPASGIAYCLVNVFGGLNAPLETLLKLSLRMLHQHELFHFAVDVMASQTECLTERPCWKPARRLRQPLGYFADEELLANAHMIRSLRRLRGNARIAGKTDALWRFIKFQPEGYRDAKRAYAKKDFERHLNALAHSYFNVVEGWERKAADGIDTLQMYSRLDPIDWRYCPVHIIDDAKRLNLPQNIVDLFAAVHGIDEPPRFLAKLQRLPQKIRSAWDKVKAHLAITTTGKGLDFKFWRRDPDGRVYSVRLDQSYRAHLKYTSEQRWIALEIGGHQELGHG